MYYIENMDRFSAPIQKIMVGNIFIENITYALFIILYLTAMMRWQEYTLRKQISLIRRGGAEANLYQS